MLQRIHFESIETIRITQGLRNYLYVQRLKLKLRT